MNNLTISDLPNRAAYKCWLNYEQMAHVAKTEALGMFFGKIFMDSISLTAAAGELIEAGKSVFGEIPKIVREQPQTPHIALKLNPGGESADSFVIRADLANKPNCIIIEGSTSTGVLYGVFAFLRAMATGKSLEDIAGQPIQESPSLPLRIMQQWDNFSGDIERGYAGHSIFYKDHAFISDMSRIRDYARLLASVGINALCINNVNVHKLETLFITSRYLPNVAFIADTLRPYGIRLFLSINFAAPIDIGGLPTADPLDRAVQDWWKEAVEGIYRHIPDFGGFVVKADSEGRPGPFSYNRDHAQGANLLARALAPYGGTVIWRCFVYNCHTDWRDRSLDRARAAYDHYTPLDGKFDSNVLLQIKNGPMDFQVREPVSPLFGALSNTCTVAEFQVTQEYTGQQKHICYLVPMWKETLCFDTFAKGEGSVVAKCIDGSVFGGKGGMAAVSNVGDSVCWTGHPLAQANLYGFGRLAWNTNLTPEEIAGEWITLTFGNDPQVREILLPLLMDSRQVYEKYTAPLGVGWMVAPNHHYGPDVDGYEYSRWGTYHYADLHGIGVDRTQKSGTGYAAQYHPPVWERYEKLETCPDELLLFFHHVPYTHTLHSGKTVIQHIYDTHFEGAETAAGYEKRWLSLREKINQEIFDEVLERIQIQTASAAEWRDIINTYFYRKTGRMDEGGRVIYP